MSEKFIIITIVIILISVAAGACVGYFWGFKTEQSVLDKKLNIIRPIRENNADYKFINPLLLYIIPSADQQAILVSLQNKIKSLIDNGKKNGLQDVSVYFSDLNHGKWIGVNEDDQYSPASMLKVIVMVAYFKESESEQGVLSRYLVYTKDIDGLLVKNQDFATSTLKIGNSYKVADLIDKMIVDSDNGALYLLVNSINQTSIDSIFAALNLKSPDEIGQDYTISPRDYSFFFRILYSSTYLNSANSEKALGLLSQTSFRDGLAAGVPQGTVVAHKFGSHVVSQNAHQQTELHDCGIIYYPKNPYLLCVMTKGDDLGNLESVVKNISSIVYQNYGSIR